MKFIANILTEKNFSDGELYNVVSDKSLLIDGLPTLVVGWEFTKAQYPDANIIDWKISDDVYWTYGNRERRSVYEIRVKKFSEIAIDRLIKSVKYIPASVITGDGLKEFSDAVNSDDSVVYIHSDIVYVYLPETKCTYGMSIRDIDYLEKSSKNFIANIYKLKNGNVITSSSGLSLELRYTLRNCNYIVPYILA